ncbi:Mevalonate kinase [Platanthera guangdongensis]|uniref:mevalonate kinase n=1 Tax=Platanthera guangdongensis TaxID=2320717 RepID=A0ABR2M9N6_9ASPA
MRDEILVDIRRWRRKGTDAVVRRRDREGRGVVVGEAGSPRSGGGTQRRRREKPRSVSRCERSVFRVLREIGRDVVTQNHGSVELELKDMGLVFSWPSKILEEAFNSLDTLPSTPQSCSPAHLRLITSLVEEKNIPEAKIWLSSGVSFCFSLSIHFNPWVSICLVYKPATVAVTSELPLGSGLGSSASFCVSLAAALLALTSEVSVDDGNSQWLTLTESNLELLNKWAFEGEKIIHGKPSGIDNTVSTFEQETLIASTACASRASPSCLPSDSHHLALPLSSPAWMGPLLPSTGLSGGMCAIC